MISLFPDPSRSQLLCPCPRRRCSPAQAAGEAPALPRAAGPAPPGRAFPCGKDHRWWWDHHNRFERPSLPEGFPTGLWQVLERRSTQFSTVPLSKTASSSPFSVEMGQCRFFKRKKGEYEAVSISWLTPSRAPGHRSLWHTQIYVIGDTHRLAQEEITWLV